MDGIIRGQVSEVGTLELSQPARGLMQKQLDKLRGAPVELTIRRFRNKRSDQANRFYWGVVVPLIAEHCGYEKDELHELLAMRFLRIDDDPITGSPRRKHTPATDSKEFGEYVDSCIRFATELGVYIPQPGEMV